MNYWNELVLAFGGNAVLLTVLAFLARSLLNTWLTKDLNTFEADLKRSADTELEKLKSELKTQGEASIEQLKNQLQYASIEHEVRFSKLHEKRGMVIEELYQRLLDLDTNTTQFFNEGVYLLTWPERKEAQDEKEKATVEFLRFATKNRIYLPEYICTLLEKLPATIWKHLITVGANDFPTPTHDSSVERRTAIRNAHAAVKSEIPQLVKKLEHEFRTMLGVETRTNIL